MERTFAGRRLEAIPVVKMISCDLLYCTRRSLNWLVLEIRYCGVVPDDLELHYEFVAEYRTVRSYQWEWTVASMQLSRT